MPTLAHVSDTHLDSSPRSIDRTRAVMRHLNSLPGPLDAVIVTGDIADNGLAEEYETARELLASRYPTVICPGNHDVRQAFRKVLLDQDGDGPVNQVLRLDGLTVALCDSSIPGRPEGFLEDETIAWLEALLAESPGTPALVGMHHVQGWPPHHSRPPDRLIAGARPIKPAGFKDGRLTVHGHSAV
jgi:Icc protein